ncbi:MAG: FMN-binding protein [Firmicutes bacterium]|nr:FMN-binding protein [Bacillota bacterium]
MNKITHLTLFLGIVSALAGGALAFANQLTAPIIAENEAKAAAENLMVMYPELDPAAIEKVDISGIDSKTIEEVYRYGDCLIFKMSVSGYKEGTTFLVSINVNDKTIDNFQAISNGDTKGIGSQVMDEPFKEGLLGKDASQDLDTISGATVSSSAVVNGIHEAANAVDQLKGE